MDKAVRQGDSAIALRLAFYGGLVVCVLDGLGQRPSIAAMAVGACVLVAAVVLRVWSQLVLGAAWSTRVRVEPQQPLVTAGPYRLVRHPAYLALIIFYLGAVIAFRSISGLMVFALGLAPAICHRTALEETALASHFGEQYLRYAAATKRILPHLF